MNENGPAEVVLEHRRAKWDGPSAAYRTSRTRNRRSGDRRSVYATQSRKKEKIQCKKPFVVLLIFPNCKKLYSSLT